jgi:serine-type D-Ala-D-Ala carboxypeptidase/endopeptidase (penicillin-binding protein 4)
MLVVGLAACVSVPAGSTRTGSPAPDRAVPTPAGVPASAFRGAASPTRPTTGGGAFELRPAPWAPGLNALIGDRAVSVSVAVDGRLRFSHLGDVPRAPASNEKLLLSMALLDTFGPRARIPTTLEAPRPVRHGVVRGNVWLVGHGDPEVDDATLDRLAAELADAGVRRVAGSVVGDTSTFRRERWAPGWHRIALSFVSIPTALTFDANTDAAGFVFDPEREAASALTTDLEDAGVDVRGAPRSGAVPGAARTIARVRSAPLLLILRRQNTSSLNLDAEVLGKRLGAIAVGGRGSIAKGARAIEAWAAEHGVKVVARDGSGLSYANRITTDGMVRLLSLADRAPWGRALRSTLPRPGTGTLAGRLAGVDVRAKTGTLIQGVSALSGWVRRPAGGRAVFSILSRGMAKDEAVAIEDAIVRFLAEHA